MESTMVIKVKYGDMLRRFTVGVHENNKLDLDMNRLRAKILNLFNFSSDTDVTLTYTDEDGDVVTLVNDDDLHELMRQQLKFLKIDVHLRNKKNGESRDRSDGSSTPLTSACGQCSFQNVRTGISEVLKSLPEPLPEFCSRILLDIASKAAVTSPVLSELAQSFIRLGNTQLNSDSPSSSVPETSTQNVACESSMAPLGADSKVSKNDGFHQEAGSNFQCTGLAFKDRKVSNSGSATKNIGVVAPASVDPNALARDSIASGSAIGNSAISAPCNSYFDGKDEKCNDTFLDPLREMSLPASMHNNPHYSPATYVDDRFINECPFSGVHVATGPSVLGTVVIDPVSSSSGCPDSVASVFNGGPIVTHSGYIESVDTGSMFREAPIISTSGFVESVGTGSMFHKGVICDGCGARPITGPRFKSQVKDNYDLCSICYAEMGNESDYIRIDRPVSCRHPRMKAFNRRHPFTGHRIINSLRSSGKQARLDSCFVADVNVLDGTVMAPCTPFTKIWRLRNDGSLNWPRGTQLVWTGGAKFSRSVSVEIEVPADGLPPGQEIEIAVDFTTPPFSGQYTSHWRMASPSGQKFGQRVWVLIQVHAALGRPDSDSSQALDLNLPPTVIGNGGSNGHEGVEKKSTSAISGVLFHSRDSSPIELVKPDHNLAESETEVQSLVKEDMLVSKNPATSSNEESLVSSYPVLDSHGIPPNSTKGPYVSYPLIDFSEPIPTANPPPVPSPKVSPAPSEKVTAKGIFEENLLKALEDMGFKEVNLNREVLKRNGYDIAQSVDELCGVAEWDPMLEELEEMGFGDKEMNRILLMKNNGSVKRVVMELLYGEKA